jgi:hypothetical protein
LIDHPVPSVKFGDADTMPGVIDMRYDPEHNGLVEVEGKVLGSGCLGISIIATTTN